MGHGEKCSLQMMNNGGWGGVLHTAANGQSVSKHLLRPQGVSYMSSGVWNKDWACPSGISRPQVKRKVYFKEMCCFPSTEGRADVGRLQIPPERLTSLCSCYTLPGHRGLALNVLFFLSQYSYFKIEGGKPNLKTVLFTLSKIKELKPTWTV